MTGARIRSLGAAVAVALLVTAASVATAHGTAPTHRPLTHTTRTVVRPVSWAAKVTPGYRVVREAHTSVDCSNSDASPAAADRDIDFCIPDAADAAACWLSRTPHRALCLRDPRRRQLVSITRTGTMAQTLPRAVRAPLGLALADGTYCSLRVGGAGASLQGHPHYGAFYYCRHGQAIWAPLFAKNWGINRSHAVWTVYTAPAKGHGTLRTRNVAKVWFVGMHG